jgi:hypothetical protein
MGRRLPGYAPFSGVVEAFLSPFSLGPWAALLFAVLLRALRTWRGMARECGQCGRPTCKYCRRYGDPLGLCAVCSRQRKESRVIDVQVRRAGEARSLARRRTWQCRSLSIFLPGTHRFFSKRPISGFLTLLLFFFFLASAIVDTRLFSPRQLAVTSSWTDFSLAALVVGALIWASSLLSSWRQPHGA